MRRRCNRLFELFAVACGVALVMTSHTDKAAAQARPAAQTRAAADPPIHLVVVFTLDQFQEPYIERYGAEMTGGIKRLMTNGAFFSNAFQDHAITETAPAHATLLSGRFPASHGILNDAADVTDATTPLIGGGGVGSSPYRFRGGVLMDWLRIQDPQSRGLSVSRKPRAAILPFGRSHQPAYWFARGRFTTSSWFADTLPAWVNAFNARRIPANHAGALWTLFAPASQYSEVDSVPIENAGRDFTFPHRMPADSTILDRIIEYPVMDSIILAFALDGVHAMNLGGGRHTDVLNISLSTTDAVGHRYGPDSREIHDQILRVDQEIGAFIDALYATVDSTRIIFALTADHGITPFPELHAASKQEAADNHVNTRRALAAARGVLRADGMDTTAISFANGMVLVNHARLSTSYNDSKALDAFTRVARALPAVTSVMKRADLARMDTVKNSAARRWIHALMPDTPAELLLTVRSGAVWGSSTEAIHGTTNDIDAHVPIFFMGAPFRAGTYTQFARTVDIAATLAKAIGVSPYERIDGRALTQAMR